MDSTNVDYGYCQCGCGQKTKLAKRTWSQRGWVKGEPLRFVHGHNKPDHSHRRGVPLREVEYTLEDRGYETPCWIWVGGVGPFGHAQTTRNGKCVVMHRVYWEHENGPVPAGHHLHHLCKQAPCIRPSHMRAMTKTEHRRTQSHAKLNPDKVSEMKRLYAAGDWSYSKLARQYGVSVGSAWMAVNGKTWK